jgi:hypothetical protein
MKKFLQQLFCRHEWWRPEIMRGKGNGSFTVRKDKNERCLKCRKIRLATVIITILISSFLIACSGQQASVNVTDPTPPIIPTLPTSPTNIIFAYYDGTSTNFFDGSAITIWQTGKSTPAGYRKICNGTMLYTLDQIGTVTNTKNIVATPDFAETDASNNIWSTFIVQPQDAYDAGAMYKYYTKIYYNGAEYGNWMTRDYEPSASYLVNGELFAKSSVGALYTISGIKTNVQKCVTDNFIMYDFNATTRTATINGVSVWWTSNWMNSADEWMQSSTGKWYSHNGYTFDGVTVTESGSAMTCWRSAATYPISIPEAPVIIAAGVRTLGGEKVFYYIECNSGWLLRYIPSTNILSTVIRLYSGDGTRTTGLYFKPFLKPITTDESVYFSFDDNMIYRYRFDNGLISILTSGAVWMREW